MRAPTLLVIAGLVAAPTAVAQQVLQVDYTTGRTIIDDEWRHINTDHLAVDPTRGVLYVIDPEEPEGIMAFSLETGEWIRTIPTPKGDGPGEFPEGRQSMAIARDGGLYVSGFVRVLKFDTLGVRVGSWTPQARRAARSATLAASRLFRSRTVCSVAGPTIRTRPSAQALWKARGSTRNPLTTAWRSTTG